MESFLSDKNINLKLINNNFNIVKLKIIKISLKLMNNEYFQLKEEFIIKLININNILEILIQVDILINYNKKIINDINLNLLRSKENDRFILFKYCYITKTFSGVDINELYYYHNCLIIFLYFCNKNRLTLKKNIFDEQIYDITLDFIKFFNKFNVDNLIKEI